VFLPALVAVSLGVVGFQAARRPVLRRLAIRDASRRPKETLLVIAGSLLGTALITGSLIVGDTLDSSVKATAFTQLGPVDEIVKVPDPATADQLIQRLRARGDPRIDDIAALVSVDASIASEAGGRKLAEPKSQLIELDFDEGRDFGGDPNATGISGSTPGTGEVAITEDLAKRLDVSEGDEVTAFLYGRDLTLKVTRTLPRTGLAGFWLGIETTSPNAFVSPGTIESLLADGVPKGAAPPLTTVLVSNRGGVEEGATLSREVTRVIEEEIDPPPVPSGGGSTLRVEEVKRDRLEAAEAAGKSFGELFIGIGSFAIIAGTLLLVNIFVMLAEERKSQLGMLRAVGMSRSHLVRAFVIEGTMYALAASIVGAALGIGVGWGIARLAAPIFSSIDEFSLELRFAIESSSLMNGFCTGLLISLFTIAVTSFRISRVNIIRAIRDLPEPTRYESRTRTVVLGCIGATVFAVWFAASFRNPSGWAAAILAPPLCAFSLLPLLSRMMNRRLAVIGVAAFSLLWGVFGNSIIGGDFFEGGDIFAFVIQGVLLTFSAVILLSQLQENLGAFARRVAARNLPIRLSIAYPLARRFRTGLTLGMFALVIFTMTFISVLSNIFGGQVESAIAKEGSFDIVATSSSTNPPAEAELEKQPGVDQVATMLSGIALWDAEKVTDPAPWPVSGIDEEFVTGGPPPIAKFGKGYETDDEVWNALLKNDSLIVIPEWFLQEGGGPSEDIVNEDDVVTMIDPITGADEERVVIGTVDNDYAFSGSYMSKRAVRSVLGANAAPSRFYIKVEPGAAPGEVARELQGRFVSNGLDAKSFRELIEQFQATNLQFFQLMQAYLALGLLVGIAGLGVVMVRAVRDRRRQVGVLRSLGFVPNQVRSAFMLESGFVALEGIVIGAALALITASQLVATGEFGQGIAFDVPAVQLLILTATALIASLIATAWPAQQASKIPPAVALRIAD
jgi:putative ABC transport system permease protein